MPRIFISIISLIPYDIWTALSPKMGSLNNLAQLQLIGPKIIKLQSPKYLLNTLSENTNALPPLKQSVIRKSSIRSCTKFL